MPCGSTKELNHQDKNGENGHCAFQDLDHSILQHPFNLGLTNVKQILKCMHNGTKEVKDIILNECNIIYECKVCANLFRSLANFLYHKRCYCKKHLCEDMLLFDNFEEESQTVVVQPEPPDKGTPNPLVADTTVPQMMDCTVKLVKTNLALEKNVQAGAVSATMPPEESNGTKEKNLRNKGSKAKDQAEDDVKKASKTNKTESPMISRRTREKNSINASKRVLKDAVDNDPPKKAAKTSRTGASSKVTGESTSKSNKESGVVEHTESMKEANKSVKEAKTVAVSSEKDVKKSTSVAVPKTTNMETETCKMDNKQVPKETEGGKSSQSPFAKPLKKIIFAKPKDMKSTNKIGFTKITNAAGKNLQCFPKIIFKTIDGNPHAVFQSTDNSKASNITLKSKFESSLVTKKSDSEKLIIVLKKDPNASSITEEKPTPEKSVKTCKNQSEFHLTRRKRLLARTDCNVQELKCLTCNTQFTSLKTLYFHMLSIHSKKRLYYPCPFCKTLFVQMYGVTRHLISIHNKTKEQINKLRDVIKKKSIWKKVDDATLAQDEIPAERRMEDLIMKEDPKPEMKPETTQPSKCTESSTLKTIIKLNKNVTLHQCSKCSRVFGRKSSQVSHEKFCIMNAIKVETVDLAGGGPISPPPNVSFLSLSPKPPSTDLQFHKPIHAIQHPPSDIKISARPKRGAEKQMHKDFVDSQTLKWRSANRVESNNKGAQSFKKSNGKNLEKKVLNIMNVENLLCMKCDKTFSSYSNLRRHVAIHVGWTRFKCKYCEYQAYNKSQCWAHVQKAHGVAENDLEKSIVNLNSNSNSAVKKVPPSLPDNHVGKHPSDVKVKTLSTKTNGIPKVKITRKKMLNSGTRLSVDKKQIPALRKGSVEKNEEPKKVRSQSLDGKKEVPALKKDKVQNSEGKKETIENKKEKTQNPDSKKDNTETKKEKSQNSETRKDNTETKKEKNQNVESKEASDGKKEKNQVVGNRIEIQDVKKDKNQHLGPVFKCTIPEYKKDASSYKSVTTNNPTTIILSKKFSSPTVQSFVTVSPESMSSATSIKTFPLRSSPRRIEAKVPEENKLTTLVTRSTAYSKGSPLQVKMSVRSSSEEDLKKNVQLSPDKTYAKKDRLISEWFPKKDLNSNNVRRESAPLIIGLVPATSSGINARSKSPVIAYERNNS